MEGIGQGKERVFVPALVAAWVFLLGVAVIWGVDHQEKSLAATARQLLHDQGIEVHVVVEGRDAVLTGAPDQESRAEAVMAGVWGVRRVVFVPIPTREPSPAGIDTKIVRGEAE